MSFSDHLRRISRILIEHRFVLSAGLSVACGIVLQSLWPAQTSDPLFGMIALERPAIYRALVWSYSLFLYSTPFLGASILLFLAYVHFYASDLDRVAGKLPEYPEPQFRRDLFLVVGEMHEAVSPNPSPQPRWFAIPERGLYTGLQRQSRDHSHKCTRKLLYELRAQNRRVESQKKGSPLL